MFLGSSFLFLSFTTVCLINTAASSWADIKGSTAPTLVGVGVHSGNSIVGATAQKMGGAELYRFEGDHWVHQPTDAAAVLLDADMESGVVAATSFFNIIVSKENDTELHEAQDVAGMSQSVSVSQGIIYAVGSFMLNSQDDTPTPSYGVIRSTDLGDSWSFSRVPFGYCRYGSFPSKDVWYVTSGMWGSSATAPHSRRLSSSSFDSHAHVENAVRSLKPFAFSAHVEISALSGKGVTLQALSGEEMVRLLQLQGSDKLDRSGWFGGISKTEDGGKTWSTVLNTNKNEVYYFNDIACTSEDHCVSVSEGVGLSVGAQPIRAHVTFDGGNTWTNSLEHTVLPDDMVSIIGAGWVNEQEGWLGATRKHENQYSGVLLRTRNGGKSYAVAEEVENCFVTDLEASVTAVVASCTSSKGDTGRMVMYTPTEETSNEAE